MQPLSEDGQRIVADAASRHGMSFEAVSGLLAALAAGGGYQAQFNHPDLGGMGQWSQGGMIMIGDMFNNGLKYRVDALCNELAAALHNAALFAPAPVAAFQSQSGGGTSFFAAGGFGGRWPAALGQPSSTGSQNDLHYAVFPASRRLALDHNGQVSIFDTGDHVITGFSQQQGGGQSITFTSQHGLVRLIDLPQVQVGAPVAAPDRQPAADGGWPVAVMPEPVAAVPEPVAAMPEPVAAMPAERGSAAASDDEIFSRIERLADLRKKDIITAAEFDAKKAELLARL